MIIGIDNIERITPILSIPITKDYGIVFKILFPILSLQLSESESESVSNSESINHMIWETSFLLESHQS